MRKRRACELGLVLLCCTSLLLADATTPPVQSANEAAAALRAGAEAGHPAADVADVGVKAKAIEVETPTVAAEEVLVQKRPAMAPSAGRVTGQDAVLYGNVVRPPAVPPTRSPLSTAWGEDASVNQCVSFVLNAPGTLTSHGPTAAANFLGAGDFGPEGTFQWMYVAESGAPHNLFKMDMATGALNVVGPAVPQGAETWSGLAWDDQTQTMYGSATDITTSGLYTIDLTTGAATYIGPMTGSPGNIALACDCNGQLYAFDIVNDDFGTVDKATGAYTAIGPLGFNANYGQGLDFDDDTGECYMAAFNSDSFQAELRLVNLVDGSSTLVGALGTPGTSQLGFMAVAETCGPHQPIYGACCDDDTGICNDAVEILDCIALGGRFAADTLCVDLVPPCGQIPGACCSMINGECIATMTEADCLALGDTTWHIWEDCDAGYVCPAVNDDCEDATPVGDVVDLPFDTSQATFDGLGTCQTAPNLWFCYTASCTGVAVIDLCGSTYDTKMAVYDGCTCNPLGTELCCNDDSCGLQSECTVNVVAGRSYLIEVGGYSSNAGPGDLSIACLSDTCCHMTVDTFPYADDFEAGMVDWINTPFGDDEDWTWQSGPTGSSNTGPQGDHTTGSGYYVYTESSGANNVLFNLKGPCFDFTTLATPQLNFWYHMYGDTMGTLSVEVSNDDCQTWQTVWTMTGDQGDMWYPGVVSLADYEGTVTAIRFAGLTGSSFTSDMAIDDIWIGEGGAVTGACCDGMICTVETEDDCLNVVGGVYQGDFTTCDPNPCVGACCQIWTLECIGDMCEAACVAIGDTAWHQYESCDDPAFQCPSPYCDICWTNTTDDWITNVTFNTINNDSGQGGACSYEDYTALVTQVAPGGTYTLSVTFYSGGSYTECVTAWFDWNADGQWDATERYDLGCGIDATLTADITVPGDAATGLSRFRVTEKYSTAPTDPCTGGSYGETEDYSMLIGFVEGACCLPDGSCIWVLPADCEAAGGVYGGAFTQCAGVDCNSNGIDDYCDLLYGISPDCNGNGIPDECDIASGFSQDCNGNLIPDECDIASGFSLDCQEDGVPDECQVPPLCPECPDCNVNGIPDECEEDCQPNGIPDDCDVDPTDPDGNGEVSLDCQGDGVPDECQLGSRADLLIFISARGQVAAGNQLFVLDETGAYITQYDQIAGAFTDAWGYRDGMSDGDYVYFGWGSGVAQHAADGSGGQLFISGGAPGGVGTWRALAYDPTGDGGNGSIWTASFASDLIETDMAGNVLTTWPNAGWSSYGLAYDHATGMLWEHDSTTGTADVWEIDPDTGQWTGVNFPSNFGDPAGIQGGLSMSGGGTLFGVTQGTPDELFSCDTTGQLVPPVNPNPLDLDTLTGENGNLGVAVIGGAGAGADCNGNGIPDECDIPIDLGGYCDPAVQTCSEDCNRNMIPDECEIAELDCNSNGVPDDCDVDPTDPDGNGEVSLDCQPNLVPDECEVPPLCPECPDCNNDGIPDDCQLDGNDCNDNGIPDDCDIASGFSEDCQPDGIPDECQLYDEKGRYTYQYDDGTHEDAIGLTAGGEIAWMNHFVVAANDAAMITEISLCWGTTPDGTASTIYLWSDPDGNGDPTDAQVLAFTDTVVQNADTDIFTTVDIVDTNVGAVGTSFFVGAMIDHVAAEYPASIDQTASAAQSWIAGDTTYNLDPNNLGGGDVAPLLIDDAGLPGNWMIRAEASAAGAPPNDCNENGVPDECDIPPICQGPECSTDYNGNGIPDECEDVCGDLDLDGDVDADDFALFLGAFGSCMGDPNYLDLADFDGDGCITLADYQAWLVCYKMSNGKAFVYERPAKKITPQPKMRTGVRR